VRHTVLTAILLGALSAFGSAACTRTVDGTPALGQSVAEAHRHAAASTAPAPRSVPLPVLDNLLLSRDDIVALVGGADMAVVNTITSTSDSSALIDERACVGVASVGDATIYANSGWAGMRGNQLSTPNAVLADATQLVTSFTTVAAAETLLQRARQDWQGCADRRYGFHSSNGNHSYFDTGALAATDSRIQLTMRQTEDPRWECSHAMAVRNNVVAETRVCLLDRDAAAAVNSLLDQVASRIPQ
jgi:PknH-like extracellular domain